MHRTKIVEREKLSSLVSQLKEQGKKIVFTNGCFDIIHTGHVRYLKGAKDMGDILVVGLNTDRSVSGIKPGRPVTPQEQRAEVLSALYMVDYITFFDEDTPLELIKKIKPDILVKGSDWRENEIVGRDIVRETHTIPLVEGISTSEIIKRIKKSC